jgi:hypothetical protein
MKRPITVSSENNFNIPNDLNTHLVAHAYLYHQNKGWFHDHPCDEEGTTPWYTYPAIAFLKDILNNEFRVFEYGAGYSTLYFHDKVTQLVTVEHDEDWKNKLIEQNPRLDIHLAEENSGTHPEAQDHITEFMSYFPQIRTEHLEHDIKHGLVNNSFTGYASTLLQAPERYYDMILVDGMARALCTYLAVKSDRLKENGIIVLDNSDRWHYNPIQTLLNENGYGRIDFWGPGWNNHNFWCTSFYSKKFGINNYRLHRPETEGFITT